MFFIRYLGTRSGIREALLLISLLGVCVSLCPKASEVPTKDPINKEDKIGLAAPTVSKSEFKQAAISENYGKLPLSFEPNIGQTDKQAKYLSRGPGYNLLLMPSEVLWQPPIPKRGELASSEARGQLNEATSQPSALLRMKLVGSNPYAKIDGAERLPSKSNYFLGNDAKLWRKGIPNFARVEYRQIYPGIDLRFYGNQRHLEYDFTVAPGARFDAIQIQFQGAKRFVKTLAEI